VFSSQIAHGSTGGRMVEDIDMIIEDVEVKQEGKDPFVAKQMAMKAAARIAFQRLLEKLELKNITTVKDEQIANCIHEYSLEREKYSDSFYIVNVSYTFNQDYVAELLTKVGLECSMLRHKKSSLMIAVYLKDYIKHIHEIKKLRHKVDRFSGNIVLMKLASSLSSFKKLGIRYARL
jgi:hypothetical protein